VVWSLLPCPRTSCFVPCVEGQERDGNGVEVPLAAVGIALQMSWAKPFSPAGNWLPGAGPVQSDECCGQSSLNISRGKPLPAVSWSAGRTGSRRNPRLWRSRMEGLFGS